MFKSPIFIDLETNGLKLTSDLQEIAFVDSDLSFQAFTNCNIKYFRRIFSDNCDNHDAIILWHPWILKWLMVNYNDLMVEMVNKKDIIVLTTIFKILTSHPIDHPRIDTITKRFADKEHKANALSDAMDLRDSYYGMIEHYTNRGE